MLFFDESMDNPDILWYNQEKGGVFMGFVLAGRSLHALRDFPTHYHSLWEIIVNLSGEGTVTANGKTYPFKEGTVICIPPRVQHFKQASEGCFTDLYLQFSGQLPESINEPFSFEDDDARTITLLVETMQRIYTKRKNYQPICDHLLKAVTELLSTRQETDIEPSIEHLTTMMATGFSDPDFSLASVVEQSGYCADHLRRMFKKHLGVSPLEYLTMLRLNYAMKLLLQNADLNHTVATVAALSGFSDVSYFSRLFKKHTHHSPLEFMKANNRKPTE